jgi:hypothetical protein
MEYNVQNDWKTAYSLVLSVRLSLVSGVYIAVVNVT